MIHCHLEVVFENEELIAINKPHGLLVHRSPMARDVKEFAIQILRDQIGQYVYPIHRLDRKTSGVLLFAKSKAVLPPIQRLFEARKINKKYIALVRGYTPGKGSIDYALTHDEKTKEAQTDFVSLEQFEINLPFGPHATSRYSLVELIPHTGRFHQLRKHMAHIFHPIIGDRPHGCNKQNKLWKDHFQMINMLLHATALSFEYPLGNEVHIKAEMSSVFADTLAKLRKENLHSIL